MLRHPTQKSIRVVISALRHVARLHRLLRAVMPPLPDPVCRRFDALDHDVAGLRRRAALRGALRCLGLRCGVAPALSGVTE